MRVLRGLFRCPFLVVLEDAFVRLLEILGDLGRRHEVYCPVGCTGVSEKRIRFTKMKVPAPAKVGVENGSCTCGGDCTMDPKT